MISNFSIDITAASLLNMHRESFSVSCAVRCCLLAGQKTIYSLCWILIDRAPHTSSGERAKFTYVGWTRRSLKKDYFAQSTAQVKKIFKYSRVLSRNKLQPYHAWKTSVDDHLPAHLQKIEIPSNRGPSKALSDLLK